MGLLDRVVAAETCRVRDCDRRRAPDAQVCRDDLTELYMNRLDRMPDGTFVRRRLLRARDLTWSNAA
jgi:hypothetical protein